MNDESRICCKCKGDVLLGERITDEGEEAGCAQCGEQRTTLSIEEIADIVKPVYESYVVAADEEMVIYADSDNPGYVQGGEIPSSIMQDLVGCEPEVADAAVEYLHRISWRSVRKGGHDYYDSMDESWKLSPVETQA